MIAICDEKGRVLLWKQKWGTNSAEQAVSFDYLGSLVSVGIGKSLEWG